MKVLHITPHLGGGVGSVILDWARAEGDGHVINCLDYANTEAKQFCKNYKIPLLELQSFKLIIAFIEQAEIVVIHYWDNMMLAQFLKNPLPPCRLVFWCHKNYLVSKPELEYPDRFIDTSPIQGHGQYIHSTRDMTPFWMLEPQEHNGFIVGYVGTVDYKKLHPQFIEVCRSIKTHNIHFIVVGENNIEGISDSKFTFMNHVSDVRPFYSVFDVFGYPLRSDHYGTCEQALGEAMCAGVVPVVLNNPAEKRIIEKTGHGIVVTNMMDYIFAIEKLARYPKRRKKLAKQSKISANIYYSFSYMRQQWANVFKQLSKQPKTRKGGL